MLAPPLAHRPPIRLAQIHQRQHGLRQFLVIRRRDEVSALPFQDRLGAAVGKTVQKDLQRGILSDALARGESITGVSLVKGHHVRLR